jgi:hypothetical protein
MGVYTAYWRMGLLALCGALQVMGVGYRGSLQAEGHPLIVCGKAPPPCILITGPEGSSRLMLQLRGWALLPVSR